MIMRILATIGTICAGGAIILVIVAIVAAVKETLREDQTLERKSYILKSTREQIIRCCS